jgi:hypothetical protein
MGRIAAVSLIALTLIAVLLAREQMVWRIVSASLGFCAVVSMALQRMWAKQVENAHREQRNTKNQAAEKERHRLYALHKVLAEVRGHESRRQSEDNKSAMNAMEKADSIIDWLFDTDPTDQRINSEWEKADLSPEGDRAFNELEEKISYV